MRRIRSVLSVALGLLLVAQGFAVAAAEYRAAASGPAQAQVVQADAATPCHGGPTPPEDGASCCDSDCPNMTSCALGHLAVAAPLQVEPAPVSHEVSAARIAAPLAAAPQTLLRPPIALHG